MTELEEYHSNNTEIFDVEAMKQLLLKLPLIRKDIYGEEYFKTHVRIIRGNKSHEKIVEVK